MDERFDEKQYIKQVVKMLKCSGEQKEEIRKQLEADIRDARERNESDEEIKKTLGSSVAMAEEFNRTFPESETEKYRKTKWIRILLLILGIAVIAAVVVYRMLPKGVPIEESSIFQEEEVKAQSEKIIETLDAGNYETMAALASSELKPYLTEEKMEEAKKTIGDNWGTFRNFGKTYMTEIRQNGQNFAMVQMNASYDNVSVTYTLTFDAEMKLAGIYMK
ncbi:MAG: DUF3887 domain-containing protein [Bariatricus sp.]|nr:DUF3887 domain-containing protein [Bariatricus sp.]